MQHGGCRAERAHDDLSRSHFRQRVTIAATLPRLSALTRTRQALSTLLPILWGCGPRKAAEYRGLQHSAPEGILSVSSVFCQILAQLCSHCYSTTTIGQKVETLGTSSMFETHGGRWLRNDQPFAAATLANGCRLWQV